MTYHSAHGRSKSTIRSVTVSVGVLLLVCATACAPTRDAQTISQLESARDQVDSLYDTFTGTTVDDERIETVRATLAGILEYEQKKGKSNALAVEQVKSIQKLFESHVAERKAAARWSGTHKNNKKELIGQAFTIAIATENEKNK